MKNIIKVISETIKGTSFENNAFIAGGFVRDLVMGKQSNDLDIVVALENGGEKLAEFLFEKGVSSKPVIFERFGTALVIIDGHKVEFVMTRKESYRTKSRKPDVQIGTLEQDVFRRDFTINSLLMNISTSEILDITEKGFADIKNRIIRSSSEPNIIFAEDPLRMLRAVRFAVELKFSIESETENGIKNNADKLEDISWERRRDELIKILISPSPVKGIRMLIELNLMKNLIPQFSEIMNVTQNRYHDKNVLEHTLAVLERTPANQVLRVSALLHDIGKARTRTVDKTGVHFYKHEIISSRMAREILNRLKFSKDDIKDVSFIIKNHMRLKSFENKLETLSNKAIRKLILSSGSNLDILLDLIHADNLNHAADYCLPEQIPEIRKRIEKIKLELAENKFPVSGRDIIDYFKIGPGKKVGRLLSKAEEIWHEHPNWGKGKILAELVKKSLS
ncbi:MAG: HD domain-containing protein [Armatimonadetes bacterium]|nr:HD domain-containing protein [Armatimonadota bacterium]